MKLHFLKTTMVLMACLVFGFAAQAQRGKMTPEKFDAHIQKLTEQLDLTKKQVRKVTKIEQEFFANMNEVRGEFKKQNRPQSAKPSKEGGDVREKPARSAQSPEQAERNKERRQKMRMVNNNHNNALKKVLTETQFEKYSTAKEARNDRMRNKVKSAKGKEKAKMKDGAGKMKKGGAVKKTQPKSELKVNEGLKKDY